jgi:hypothetical protein
MATKSKLKITTTPVIPIVDTFGLSAMDISKSPKINDAVWQGLASVLKPLYIEPFGGSEAVWVRYEAVNPNCYNIDPIQARLRNPPQSVADINGGICNRQYGYGFFQDIVGAMSKMNPKPAIEITINLAEPILLNSYASTFSQIDFVILSCRAAGIPIRCFQLCYETGITANADIFPTSESIRKASQDIADFINNTYPGYTISCDSNITDDTTLRLKDLNATMNGMQGVAQVRNYFQIESNTYAEGLIRVATFSHFLDTFSGNPLPPIVPAQFTHGQKMRLAQARVKAGSALVGTLGESLLYSNLILQSIIENSKRNNLISDFLVDVGRAISNTNQTLTLYQFLMLIRGALQNDGLITAEYVDTDATNLLTVAVKRGAGTETYINNKGENDIPLEAVRVDGKKLTRVTATGLFGDPILRTFLPYNYTGASPVIKGNSLTMINTLPSAAES